MKAATLLSLTLFGCQTAVADSATDISGSLRAAHYSDSARLDGDTDVLASALWLRVGHRPSGSVSLLAEGWLRNDDSLREPGWRSRLREAWLEISGERLDVRIGQQVLIWGRADRFNPTDNLTPRDFTLLVPEEYDQRLGVAAGRVTWHAANGGDFSVLWLPRFRPNQLPLPARAGVNYLPVHADGQQFAVRHERTGGRVDWSLSFFNGYDLNPWLRALHAGPDGVALALQHERLRILGMDAATVAGRFGLRMEAAWVSTESAGPDDFSHKKPFVWLVAGGDRTFGEYLNVNIQGWVRHVQQFRAADSVADPQQRQLLLQAQIIGQQQAADDYGFTLRLAHSWLNETLQVELAGVHSLQHKDFALRPRLQYALNDALRLTLGLDLFRGPAASFYGQLRDNSSAFIELRYSF